jgi:hypothetical protein
VNIEEIKKLKNLLSMIREKNEHLQGTIKEQNVEIEQKLKYQAELADLKKELLVSHKDYQLLKK